MLIDSHAHICDLENAENVVNNFEKDDLKTVVCASYDLKSSKQAIELAQSNDKIYAIIGIHPENCFEFNDEFITFLTNNLNDKKVIGVGEIGLDFHFEGFDKDKQIEVFLAQAKIANQFNVPVFIHLRDAYGCFLEVLKNNVNLFTSGLVFHCFCGSVEFANEILKLIPNVYFAFGGSVTFKNAKNVQLAVKQIPIDRILSETDCPFLTPEPLRGKEKNQPKNVNYVVQKLADLKEITKDKMEIIIEENFNRLIKK